MRAVCLFQAACHGREHQEPAVSQCLFFILDAELNLILAPLHLEMGSQWKVEIGCISLAGHCPLFLCGSPGGHMLETAVPQDGGSLGPKSLWRRLPLQHLVRLWSGQEDGLKSQWLNNKAVLVTEMVGSLTWWHWPGLLPASCPSALSRDSENNTQKWHASLSNIVWFQNPLLPSLEHHCYLRDKPMVGPYFWNFLWPWAGYFTAEETELREGKWD